MDKVQLKATKRELTGRGVKKLRREGVLPANLYGKKIKSESLQVQMKEFRDAFAKAGKTGLIELVFDGKKHPVLIQNIQSHPVDQSLLHTDFFEVDLREKVTTKVPLVVIGEAPAVKDKIGVLLNILSEIEVEALPADLPDKIEVDISMLKAIGDLIKISDLSVSEKVKILTSVDKEILKIAPLVSKEAEKMAAEEAAAAASAASVTTTEAGGPASEVQASATTSAPETTSKIEEKK